MIQKSITGVALRSLALISFFSLGITPFSYAETDTTPPTLEVGMPDKTAYCPGDPIKFQVVIKDDISGFSNKSVRVFIMDDASWGWSYHGKELNYFGSWLNPNGEIQSKNYLGGTFEAIISEYAIPGTYWIFVLNFEDNAGNRFRYPEGSMYLRKTSISMLDSSNSICLAAADKAAADKAAADKAAADKEAADKEAADKAAAVQAAEEKAALDRYIALSKAAEEEAKTKTKEKSIICVKGKSTKKITGKSPKCPAGYKVKK